MKKWKGDLVFLVVIGLLVGGWLYLYPHQSGGPLSPLDPPDGLADEGLDSYASYEGLKLAYRLYEPTGDARHVLVFLHDTLLHSGWYVDLARDLASEGIAVYLPDRRGRGHSDGDPRAVSEDRSVLLEDITAMIAVAQDRYPQAEIYLGGHGRGAGLVASYAALQRPIAGVILVSPYITDEQPNLRPEGWQALIRAHPGEAFLARSGLVNWRVWHYSWPQSMLEADPMIETSLSIADMLETVPADPAATYQALRAPLLCVQGQDDPLFYVAKTSALVSLFAAPDRQLETVPGAGYLTVIGVAANPIAHWLEGR
jgi:alpha-beta hydrolase superfamily lysophospholipase